MISFYLYTSYVNHPEGEKVTNDWLSSGDYEIEALGIRYPAKLHLKSPFDSKNMRIQGEYNPEELRYLLSNDIYHQLRKLLFN